MAPELRRHLNGFAVLLSVLVGVLSARLDGPTTGEAIDTGSVFLWTAVFSLAVGGVVYLAFLGARGDARDRTRELSTRRRALRRRSESSPSSATGRDVGVGSPMR